MNQVRATVIEDSVGPAGRITTFQLRYPRFIHAEFLTHRVFSRNSASSRAIPTAKLLDQVRNDPAIVMHWGKNQPGMQAQVELDGPERLTAQALWRKAASQAADIAEEFLRLGLHKQAANRVLEPFQFMHTVVTATEWDNFFALRLHPAAQPEIQHLARAMHDARECSTPTPRKPGAWHLPYVLQSELDPGGSIAEACSHVEDPVRRHVLIMATACAASSARCARVSYLTHDGQVPDLKKDLMLFTRLFTANPMHASPMEHQAQALETAAPSGNFVGWEQWRKTLEKIGPEEVLRALDNVATDPV